MSVIWAYLILSGGGLDIEGPFAATQMDKCVAVMERLIAEKAIIGGVCSLEYFPNSA